MGAFERCMRFKTDLTLGIQFYTFDKRTRKNMVLQLLSLHDLKVAGRQPEKRGDKENKPAALSAIILKCRLFCAFQWNFQDILRKENSFF